jgi:acetyl-CoA carboxylase biotin carboxyl carrier protein
VSALSDDEGANEHPEFGRLGGLEAGGLEAEGYVDMELKEIKQLIRMVDEKRFAEFELEKADFKLRIKRNETPVIHYAVGPPISASDGHPAFMSPMAAPVAGAQAGDAAAGEEAGAAASADLHLITSPIVGTFYRAPSPSTPPFVSEGERVEPGKTLCIVEAMKLMNEIPSDVAGEVVKIHAENGQPVEYGQPLFSVRLI